MTRRESKPTPSLSPIELRALLDVFRSEAGLAFAEDSVFVIERRLRDRLTSLGLSSFSEYLEAVRTSRAELEEALEIVTTHETYFFREAYQLRAFREEILPSMRQMTESRRRLSVWSAGCSTGEEAYTIGMLLHETRLFEGWELRILGGDISKRCINAARKAVYGPSAFRAAPTEYRNTYFQDEPEGARVSPEIRAMCTFAQMNLLDPGRCAVVGRVEAIFCRNVLIYLDADARRRVIATLYDRLVPGGYLMLGHSESLLNVSSAFEVVNLREDIVYRKPATSRD